MHNFQQHLDQQLLLRTDKARLHDLRDLSKAAGVEISTRQPATGPVNKHLIAFTLLPPVQQLQRNPAHSIVGFFCAFSAAHFFFPQRSNLTKAERNRCIGLPSAALLPSARCVHSALAHSPNSTDRCAAHSRHPARRMRQLIRREHLKLGARLEPKFVGKTKKMPPGTENGSENRFYTGTLEIRHSFGTENRRKKKESAARHRARFLVRLSRVTVGVQLPLRPSG